MSHQVSHDEYVIQYHSDLVRYIALNPSKRVTIDLIDKVTNLVKYVNYYACYIDTKRSVFARVEKLALRHFGMYPPYNDYSQKQKELLEVLDYCCLYPPSS